MFSLSQRWKQPKIGSAVFPKSLLGLKSHFLYRVDFLAVSFNRNYSGRVGSRLSSIVSRISWKQIPFTFQTKVLLAFDFTLRSIPHPGDFNTSSLWRGLCYAWIFFWNSLENPASQSCYLCSATPTCLPCMDTSFTISGLTLHIFQVCAFTRYKLFNLAATQQKGWSSGSKSCCFYDVRISQINLNRAHNQAVLVQHSNPQSVVLRPVVSGALGTG